MNSINNIIKDIETLEEEHNLNCIFTEIQARDIDKMESQRQELIKCVTKNLTNSLDNYLNVLHKLATNSSDKRIQATTAMYLIDRILGKISVNISTDDKCVTKS